MSETWACARCGTEYEVTTPAECGPAAVLTCPRCAFDWEEEKDPVRPGVSEWVQKVGAKAAMLVRKEGE